MDDMQAELAAQIDRLIEATAPQQIIVTSVFTFPISPPPLVTDPTTMMELFNAMLVTFEGYRGVCTYCDVATGFDNTPTTGMLGGFGIHWNPSGQQFVADRIIAKLRGA
jgi:hypothetical protein